MSTPSTARGDGSATPAAWRLAARLQGVYYLVTGAWPLLHMRSFVALTGPKRDLWLVRSTGSMIAALGAGLLAESRRGRVAPSWALAGAVGCAGLAAVDLSPGPPRRISRMYLADAAVEIGLLALWVAGALRRGRRRRPGIMGAPGFETGATGVLAMVNGGRRCRSRRGRCTKSTGSATR